MMLRQCHECAGAQGGEGRGADEALADLARAGGREQPPDPLGRGTASRASSGNARARRAGLAEAHGQRLGGASGGDRVEICGDAGIVAPPPPARGIEDAAAGDRDRRGSPGEARRLACRDRDGLGEVKLGLRAGARFQGFAVEEPEPGGNLARAEQQAGRRCRPATRPPRSQPP